MFIPLDQPGSHRDARPEWEHPGTWIGKRILSSKEQHARLSRVGRSGACTFVGEERPLRQDVHTLGAIMTLVFWALIVGGNVLLGVWLVRNANHGRLPIGSSESPLDIVKTHYAKGEITKEQFDTIKRDLGA